MINPVSSGLAIPATAQKAPPPKAQQASSAAPQDTVKLSPAALAQASGDVDHDGDSH
jgi:hypothetical protein